MKPVTFVLSQSDAQRLRKEALDLGLTPSLELRADGDVDFRIVDRMFADQWFKFQWISKKIYGLEA